MEKNKSYWRSKIRYARMRLENQTTYYNEKIRYAEEEIRKLDEQKKSEPKKVIEVKKVEIEVDPIDFIEI